MKNKKINYDPKSDVFSIIIREGYEEQHEEVAPGIFIELDKKGAPIGIEILNASENIGVLFQKSVIGKSSMLAG